MCLICDLRSGHTPAAPDAPDSHRWSSRRGFLLAAAAATASVAAPPALGQVNVGAPSRMRRLVPADVLENAAAQQFTQMMRDAGRQGALLPDSDPQVQRLRAIARRLIPHAEPWNPRARGWQWQVQLIRSDQINAFCMPGGKIAFFTGILEQLKLDDDEAAMIMGHEMAHALREHARSRLAKSTATDTGLRLGAALLGLGDLGNLAAGLGAQLLTLKYSRDDETEADLVGLELAARGAYRPQASVSLWQKMARAGGSGGPAFLSTHPSGPNRIRELEANVPKVQGLYEAARRG
ncbi:MAG TPA: M48 family metallopeptidase [Hydrogenophaga sp.]|uniref:M48 family metallopeptidase n=1 Tax=Hydrogenophaga sp. TaxID=1904254 RepID=UPI002C4B7187|nr:M48 family metallopeptidase [Hydrogenophaga sp.]HMN94202.1 M48 family metallopeptidase [Hydrogenophaga sp.]HMP08730.1 M48 family metallopeptidase [Hydrogenophaga sp.]